MNPMNARRPITRNGQLACSNCAWTRQPPKVGFGGSRSGKAKIATWRGWFGRHNCALHPLDAR